MLQEAKSKLFALVRIAIALTPCILAMYTLYWLGKNEVWDAQTPHRDIMSGAVVAGGMAATFLTHTFLAKRWQTKT
ncbi:MAG: hypothetical protein AAFX52_07075 [Pseudomonadota bacterium]